MTRVMSRPLNQVLSRPHNKADRRTWDVPSAALEKWSDTYAFAPVASSDKSVIDIYDVIGEDWWDGSGFTEAKLAGILRDRGDGDVTVNINSPGGDAFAGIAIFNRLKAHNGKVTVNVVGMAASAASIIAMAGDVVNVGTGSIIMIHNAWGLTIGNRHDFAEAAIVFGQFDRSLASIYVERTGQTLDSIVAMMDGQSDGTYLTADEAVELKFADSHADIDQQVTNKARIPEDVLAKRRVEAALAKDGVSRKERGNYLNQLAAPRDAAASVERDADDDAQLSMALSNALNVFKKRG